MPDPSILPITQRECDRCREGTERTLEALKRSIDTIAEVRTQDSLRLAGIDGKVDALTGEIKTIQVTLENRRQTERGLIGLLVKLAPLILGALIGGGGLYKASQTAPDPQVIQQAVEQAIKTVDGETP